MRSANPRLIVARWLARTASSAWGEGERDSDGEGWYEGDIIYGLKSKEDMGDGSLVPPVRDSYGNPRKPPEVPGSKGLIKKVKGL